MELLVNTAQVFPINMRIDLGGRDVDVAEHLLDRTEVRPTLEQVRGEGMPQRMRRNRLGDSRLLHVFAEDLPRAHPGQRLPARIQEENALPFPFLQLGPELPEIDRRCANLFRPIGTRRSFAPFPKTRIR